MKWSDFSPYVLPYVTGCPEPVLEQHIRLAAIEFFRRTLAYRQTLEPVAADGKSVVVDLEPPSQTQIIKIKSASVNGRAFTLVGRSLGVELARHDTGDEFVFSHDGRTLSVYPLQTTNTPVDVDVALAPSITSTALDDAMASSYMQDIAQGAIASIKLLPNQPFTDPAGAMPHQALFQTRISSMAAKLARGATAAKMRSYAKFL